MADFGRGGARFAPRPGGILGGAIGGFGTLGSRRRRGRLVNLGSVSAVPPSTTRRATRPLGQISRATTASNRGSRRIRARRGRR